MASSKRDDFSKTTIEKAAKRVAYRCSCPTCNQITIGPSYESDSSITNVGVAAHIYAASPGGPRYNPKMTAMERKSISNCLWLCQTHATMIDRDIVTYTPEKLISWKKDAETSAFYELAKGNTNFLENYMLTYDGDMQILSDIVDKCIYNGEYDILKNILSSYRQTQSLFLNEFILRKQIVYDIYCDRNSIELHLSDYLKKTNRSGLNEILALLCSFLLSRSISIIQPYCTNTNLLYICDKIQSGEIFNCFFSQEEKLPPTRKVSAELIGLYRCIQSNVIYKNNLFNIKNRDTIIANLYVDGFFHRVQKEKYIIDSFCYLGQSSNIGSVNKAFEYLIGNITNITLLDSNVQIEIWKTILTYKLDKLDFEDVYKLCPDEIAKFPELHRLYIIYCIQNAKSEYSSLDQVFQYSNETDDYPLMYDTLVHQSDQMSVDFLNDHQFLYKKDICFIFLMLIVYGHYNFISDQIAFLEKYREYYPSNFVFNCLLVWFQKEQLDWSDVQALLDKNKSFPMFCLTLYIDILAYYKQWDELYELSKVQLPYRELCRVAYSLASEATNYQVVNTLLDEIIEKNYIEKGLLLNKGQICVYLGHTEEALKCFQNEYDLYQTEDALMRLLQLRFDLRQVVEDQYLLEASKILSASIQNMVASCYMQLESPTKANYFFLRSLLIDKKLLPSLTGYFASKIKAGESTMQEICEIKENTVCLIYNETKSLKVALYEDGFLSGIEPSDFADCVHLCIDDPAISSWRWRRVGERVEFNGESFIIEAIQPSDYVFFQYSLNAMQQNKQVTLIKATNGEELFAQIIPILKETADSGQTIIDNYNKLQIRTPLSLLSLQLGKPMLDCLDYLLFHNKEKYRNNPCDIMMDSRESTQTLLFSYESILLASYLNVISELKDKFNIVCTNQVKSQLMADISSELSDIKNDNNKGIMSIHEDTPLFMERSYEMRRNRLEYLIKTKRDVESIPSIQGLDWNCSKHNIAQTLSQNGAFCECSCLGTAQGQSIVLISDDEFTYSLANYSCIPNAGICSLIAQCNCSWKRFLEISQKMHELNFSIYLSPHLLKAIIRDIKKNNSIEGSKALGDWLEKDSEDSVSEYHRYQIDQLMSQVLQAPILQFDTNEILFLAKYALVHREYFHPGTIQSYFSNYYNTET